MKKPFFILLLSCMYMYGMELDDHLEARVLGELVFQPEYTEEYMQTENIPPYLPIIPTANDEPKSPPTPPPSPVYKSLRRYHSPPIFSISDALTNKKRKRAPDSSDEFQEEQEEASESKSDDKNTLSTHEIWAYKIQCPYKNCLYEKKNQQDAEHDARLAKQNTIYALYVHLKKQHVYWPREKLDYYAVNNLHAYQISQQSALEHYFFTIECPDTKCLYKKTNHTSESCGINRAKSSVSDALRGHIKRCHPQLLTKQQFREYCKKNMHWVEK